MKDEKKVSVLVLDSPFGWDRAIVKLPLDLFRLRKFSLVGKPGIFYLGAVDTRFGRFYFATKKDPLDYNGEMFWRTGMAMGGGEEVTA